MTPIKIKNPSLRYRMMRRLMPLLLLAVLFMTGFSYFLTRDLLIDDYENQVQGVLKSTIHSLSLVDHGYGLLDQHLETEMSAVLKAYKEAYVRQSGPLDLKALKAELGGFYDLMIIDEQTTIIDSTIPEGLNFNFKAFDPVLGEKIASLLQRDQIVHEKIRTNVGTGYLSKFSYLPLPEHKVILEIAYTVPGYENMLKTLDPAILLNQVKDSFSNVVDIDIYDIYGYQYSHGGELYEPTTLSLALVKRALNEQSFVDEPNLSETGDVKRHVVYLPDQQPKVLSDHGRVLAITFSTDSLKKLQNILFAIVLSGGTLTLIISAAILYFEIRNMTKPVSQLTLAAQEVSTGNYNIQVPVEGSDEIAVLSEVFNQMIKTIDEHYSDLSGQFKTMLYSMGDGVVVVDPSGIIRLLNPIAEKLMKVSNESVLGQPYASVMGLPESDLHMLTNIEHSEYRMVHEDGTILTLSYTQAPLPDGGAIFVLRDMTEHRLRMKHIQYLSENDQLTGLLNRRAYEKELVMTNEPSTLPLSIILMDLNGLKLVNDAFGHLAGDRLLKTTAQILKETFDPLETIFRIGGDEFIVLLPQVDEHQVEEWANRLLENTDANTDNLLGLSLSLGFATRTSLDQPLDALFVKAEDDMYRNKLTKSKASHQHMIEHITQLVFDTNPDLRAHTERVTRDCVRLAETLGLSEERLAHLKRAAWHHDLGKINAADSQNDRHPEVGYQILKSVTHYALSAELILCHHEYWDGSGYPRGLKGDEIPLEAQILALCNWCDDLSTNGHMNRSELESALHAESDRLFSSRLISQWLVMTS